MKKILKKYGKYVMYVLVIVIVLAFARALGCGCAGGRWRDHMGVACGCAPPARKEKFSFGKVGEFIGAAGALAGLGVADVVGSTGRWAAGEVMDGARHVAGAIEGKAVHPIERGSFWIW